MQGGSEIWKCPDFEWLKRSWLANGPNFYCDLKPGTEPFEKWPKLKSGVFILDLKWSGFQMVRTIALAIA